MTIRWLPRAISDLEEILSYVAEHLSGFYDSTVEDIFSAIDSLVEMPFRGKPTNKPNIRQFVLPRLPYIVFYKLRQDAIEILYIRHGARKPRP